MRHFHLLAVSETPPALDLLTTIHCEVITLMPLRSRDSVGRRMLVPSKLWMEPKPIWSPTA